MSSFDPVEIAVLTSGDETLLVAQDREGRHRGVVCPHGLADTLQTFVNASNPRLVGVWRAYSQSRGDGAFFWDLIGIAEAIRDLAAVPGIRRLLRFESEGELFHNTWQARLIRVARASGKAVEMPQPTPGRRQPDLRVHPGTALEVKVLIGDSTIEIGRDGWRVSPPDIARIAKGVAKRCRDALGQVGPDGVVAVALWCDLAANAVEQLGITRPLGEAELLPGTLVLALNPSLGPNPHTAAVVPLRSVDPFLESVAERLMAHSLPIEVPFTGRFAGVTNCADWTAVGRAVSIANWTTQYAPYEVAVPSALRKPGGSTAGSTADGFRPAGEAMAAYQALVSSNPLASRTYSAYEVNTDPRFLCLIGWGCSLIAALVALRERPANFDDLLPPGRPREDAVLLLDSTAAPDGRVVAEALLRLDGLVDRMTRLTTHLAFGPGSLSGH